METKRHEPNIYPIIVETDHSNLRSYNFYLVHHEPYLFLVDAGYNDQVSWDRLMEVLEQHRFHLTDIDAILLTHHHFDHIGLVNRIVAQHRIPIYAHKEAIVRLKRDPAYLQKRIRFFNHLYRQMGCTAERVDQEIERLKRYVEKNELQIIDGDIQILREGDYLFGFEVIEVIGHSLDQIAFYHRESGQLLAGDHMIQHMSSNALIDVGKRGERPRSLVYYERSLKRLQSLPMQVVYPGHGEIITEPYSLLEAKLGRIQERGQLILQMLSRPQSPAAIAKSVYKDRYDRLFPLVMSEIIGHIDRLHYLGWVERIVKDGIYYYESRQRPRI